MDIPAIRIESPTYHSSGSEQENSYLEVDDTSYIDAKVREWHAKHALRKDCTKTPYTSRDELREVFAIDWESEGESESDQDASLTKSPSGIWTSVDFSEVYP